LDYDASAAQWSRARDVLAGEDAVKRGGERYLSRLDAQSEEDYCAYKNRGSFFNATSRTAEGYSGLIFRRPPFVVIPEGSLRSLSQAGHPSATAGRGAGSLGTANATGIGRALGVFINDADMLGTSLFGYAKNVVHEVVGVGRAGTLVDWCSSAASHLAGPASTGENRAYVSMYSAEQILNWRIERVNGRNVATLIVLSECVMQSGNSKVENRNSNSERRGGDTTPYLFFRLIAHGDDDGAKQCRG
jgi:hypothetical protein